MELPPRAIESLLQVEQAVERATNLTRQLLAFSRKQIMQPQPLDLKEVVAQLAKMLRRILGEDITLHLGGPQDPAVAYADRSMIEQVMMNLAVNARDAMPKGGRLTVETATVAVGEEMARKNPNARPGTFISLTVTDTGCGIAPEIMPHLFEPFFTTKEVGKGTGLGLATVYGIVKQHGGWVEVSSEPNRGARFRVFLPQSDKPVAAAAPTACPEKPPRGHETILVVEDEPALRDVARDVLLSYGYRVYTACSGLDALGLWSHHAAEIDLLLTDMIMPDGLTGRDLAARLEAQKKGLKVIFMSGYSLELVSQQGFLSEGIFFLQKPYSPDQLARMIRDCLDGKPRPQTMTSLPCPP
jgi:CheY-like chemotaxis protein